jgi:hypothetical protein
MVGHRPATSALENLHKDEEQPTTQSLLGSLRRGTLALGPDPAGVQQLLQEVEHVREQASEGDQL